MNLNWPAKGLLSLITFHGPFRNQGSADHFAEGGPDLSSLKPRARDQASECDVAWGSTLDHAPRKQFVFGSSSLGQAKKQAVQNREDCRQMEGKKKKINLFD